MKRYKILFFVAMAAMATSCQKDFLDRYPQTSVTPEVFFNTEEDLALYINGMLSLSGHGMYLSDKSTDNLATTAAVDRSEEDQSALQSQLPNSYAVFFLKKTDTQ